MARPLEPLSAYWECGCCRNRLDPDQIDECGECKRGCACGGVVRTVIPVLERVIWDDGVVEERVTGTTMNIVRREVPDGLPEIKPFAPQALAKSWGDEILVAHAPGLYTGKILKRYARPPFHRGGLQFHVSKDETFYLHEGEVWVYWVDRDGALRRTHMVPGMSFHVPPGAIHSVQTITDSVMFEASNPVFDDRVNVEAQYDVRLAVG